MATDGRVMYVVIVANFMAYAVAPTLQSIVSRSVPADRQGLTRGSLQAISSLMYVFAPLIGTTLLATTSHLPSDDIRVGGTFFLCACFQFVALMIAVRFFKQRSRSAEPQ
jgi:DHA1 family tetracycline resistance protein-like MFS transporter